MEIEPLIYFGTAAIAVPALQAIARHYRVAAVCTQPDRPSGRKRVMTASPVKLCAQELGLPVIDPEKIGDAKAELLALRPSLAVVFAYGQYLPKSIFALPTQGSINLHPSRLPCYRGASPIQSALADGLDRSALSVLRVSERMDAGDLLLQRDFVIHPDDSCRSLGERVAALSADVILDALRLIREDSAHWTPQDDALATECRKLEKGDGAVDWNRRAVELANAVRAYDPWPGVFFSLPGVGNVKILRARAEKVGGTPGTVITALPDGPLVTAGEGSLCLLEVQPPGKKPMNGSDFLHGYRFMPGLRLPKTVEEA